jgi:plasmid maintenance system antidote protein VapI
MAIRLGKFFGTSPEFWMNLQTSYELTVAHKSLKNKVRKIKPYSNAA